LKRTPELQPNLEVQDSSRKLVFIFLLWCAVLILAAPVVTLFRAVLLVAYFTFPQAPFQPLDLISRAPEIHEVTFKSSSGRIIEASLYTVPGSGKKPGTIIYCPLATLGKRDPYIERIAAGLARSGIVTLVPFPKKPPALPPLDEKDALDVQASFQYLSGHPEVLSSEIGLIGVSYGNCPVIRAAASRQLSGRVKYILSMGGYYDLKNVIKFAVTGTFEYKHLTGHQEPRPYVRTVLLETLKKGAGDKQVRDFLEKHGRNIFGTENSLIPSEISVDAAGLIELLMARDGKDFDKKFEKLPEKVHRRFALLSPYPILKNLHTRVLILHSKDDPYIPYTESLRLYNALPEDTPSKLVLIDIFEHTVPKPLTSRNIVSHYIPALINLIGIAYHIV